MKKLSKALMLLSAGTLLALGSCTNGGATESKTPGDSANTSVADSSEPKSATRIKHEEIPYMEEGVILDLDKYVTIEYADGSTDKNYEISCSKAALVIVEGTHKIKSDETDTYTIVVKAGPLTTKLTIEVLSNDQLKLMKFLEPLEENPRNFTIDLSAENQQGQDQYLFSYFHNENYTGVWNKDNPTEVDENGEPNSTILAKLSDGNAYWGDVRADGSGNPKAHFEPGPVKNWDWYYFTMDMPLDAADSAWTTYEGEDVLMLGPTFCQNLLNYGCSQLPDRNYPGIEYYGAIVVDYIDTNIDGNPDKYVFDCLLKEGNSIETYCRVTLYDIGTTNPAFMQQATTQASYVPAKITADEIPTAFNALNTAGNYTMTLKAWSCTSSSLTPYTPAPADIPEDACANLFGTTDMVITQKVTSAGIYSEYKGKKLNQAANGYTVDANYSLMDVSAVYNAGNKGYVAEYDGTDGSPTQGQIKAATEITGVTNVFALNEVKAMTAGAVTSAAVNGTTWTSKTEDAAAHTVTFKGDAGDNDGATVHENALLEQLLNMFGTGTYGTMNNMGTTWTKAEEFSQGDKHALSLYSSYDSFTVNTATNEVSIVLDMYAPIGLGNGYFGMSITIDHIGTTSFDFSTLTAGVVNPGLLA